MTDFKQIRSGESHLQMIEKQWQQMALMKESILDYFVSQNTVTQS